MNHLKKISILLILLFLSAACATRNSDLPKANNLNTNQSYGEALPTVQISSGQRFKMGALEAKTRATNTYFEPNYSGTYPASFSIAYKMPPVKTQGQQGSCVAWAVAYAAKTFQEGIEEKWDISLEENQFSPAWIYNQINGGQDNGSYVRDALNLLRDKGVDTWANFPYNENDYTTQPDAESIKRAWRYRAKAWAYIKNNVKDIKAALLEGHAVVFQIKVYNDLTSLGPYNEVYDEFTGPYQGSHAMAIVGYNDERQAFQFINSWGTQWGTWKNGVDNTDGIGYGWVAYSMVTSTESGFLSYAIMDKENANTVDDNEAPSLSFQSPVNGADIARGTVVNVNLNVIDNYQVDEVRCFVKKSSDAVWSNEIGRDSTSPYTCQWDLSSYNKDDQGSYQIKAVAYDASGNSSEKVIDVNMVQDATHPYVSIISPTTDQSISSDTLNVATQISDDKGISKVEYFVDSKKLAEKSSAPYNIDLSIIQFNAGNHTLLVKAHDTDGNIEEAWVNFNYAKEKPSVQINTFENGANLQGVQKFAAVVSDNNNGVTKVEFYVGNSVVKTITDLSVCTWNTYCSFDWDTSTVNNGSYTLKVKAYDVDGNTGEDSVTVIVKNPFVCKEYTDTNYNHIQAGRAKEGGLSNLYAHAVGSNESLGLAGSAYYSSSTTMSETAAGYFVKGSCPTDNSGEESDTSAPSNVAITSPSAGAMVDGTVTISASASDNVGVTKVEFYINGILKGSVNTSPYQYIWNTDSLSAGSAHNLTVKAYDAAGNITESSVVTVNKAETENNDELQLIVSSPESGAAFSKGTTITVNGSSAGAVKITVALVGASSGTVYSTQELTSGLINWSTELSTSGVYWSGSYKVKVSAEDANGASQVQEISITL